ncbi:unnamed protein product [Effrenium voratum]|uniref:PI3K/PI4K catalytic domain-containing protein n=1 Tax=Effrenium voratum TaxID=2562239 RepID=A0AA36MJR8_9DINO|nr:unnamed protein product [Effrenium voratum]
MERVGELEPLHLANLCWSFANVSRSDELNDQRKPGFRHPALFEALARAASRLAGGLLPQHHASTLWAFAVCEVRSGVPALIDAMLPAMRARLKEYEPRQAAGMLWAVAVLSQHHQPLIDFLLHAVCHTGTEGLVRDGPAHLASIVWAAARLPRTPGLVEQALGHRRLLAAELAGSAAELSEGRRQNIAAVVRSMYEMGLSQAAAALLNDFDALGLMSPGVEAWSAWLWGAASIGDAQLEATAWSGLAASCDGIPRSTFVLNAAAARALAAGREDLARWALTLLQQEGECDMVTNQLRNRVGLGADTVSGDWARGEYSKELSLVRHLCSATPPQCPAELLKAAEASKNWEILQLGAGQRGAALDAALALLPKRRCVVVELGCGVGCASMRAAVRLASSGGLVITCDADPVRSAAAICLNEWAGTGSGAGKFGNVDVRVGRGEQLLPQLRKELGPRSVDMLILGGFQGTEYQEELVRALELDLLAVDGSVVADRVLEPMAPGLLWLMQTFQECFAVVTDDDWVVIASAYEPREGLAPPEAVLQLRHSADEARRRSLAWRYRNRMVAGPTLATQDELEAAQAAYQKLGILPKLRQPMRSGGVAMPGGWSCEASENPEEAVKWEVGRKELFIDARDGGSDCHRKQNFAYAIAPIGLLVCSTSALRFRPGASNFSGSRRFAVLSKAERPRNEMQTMGHLWCLEVVAISSPSALGGRAAAKSWWPLIFMVNVQLNQIIVHAGMPERILQVVDENFDQLNAVNLITALHRLAAISLASKKAALRRDSRCKRLVNKLSDTIRKADPLSLKPQDLSNAAWGLTKLGIQSTTLFNLLSERILVRIGSFQPVNLSMTLWAFARSGLSDEKLLQAAAQEVKNQLKDFEPQQIANTTWAMAKCGFVDEELFARAADHAISQMDKFQPMNFSMLLYSYALAQHRHQELFEEVAKRCTVETLTHSLSAGSSMKLQKKLTGQTLALPPVDVAGTVCRSIRIERDFHSASNARLLCLEPTHSRVILKFADVRQEAAIMEVLKHMNPGWTFITAALLGMSFGVSWTSESVARMPGGHLVQTVTYQISPLGSQAGTVEAISECWNLRELAESASQRHLRVAQVLPEAEQLNRLAATSVAFLASGYALGLRDSHDDNIMLRKDGSLFRVDFGYVFGASPALDAPPTLLPNAVFVALGEARWREVVVVCERALMAISGNSGSEPPGWACVRQVPDMALLHHEAFAYVKTLSLESFREEVRRATEWSMSRAAKNRLREVVRFWRHEEPEENPRAREIKQISWVGQPPGDEDAPDPPEDFDEPSIFVSL